jgi:hypothetical protein
VIKIRILFFAAVLCASANVSAKSYLPADDNTVLAQVATRADPQVRELAALRHELVARSQDLSLAAAYARKAITLGHQRSDPRYYGYAQAALQPWWALPEPPTEVLILRASIRQFFHAFDPARADLDLALTRNPADAQARLIRATVEQVQGNPKDALHDCEQLSGRVPVLISTACSASAASLIGRASKSDALLGFVLDQSPQTSSADRLWAETLLAEIAERLGHDTEAALAFQRALKTMDQSGAIDAYLLAAYADFAIAQGQADAVISRLNHLTDIDNLLLRLALAEQAAGHTSDLTRHRQMLEDRFAAARQRGDAVHLREEAIYQLHIVADPQHALALAQQNWRSQREPLDALILLQACVATRQKGAATPVLDWMQQTALEDHRLQALAGLLK